jgi:hypothetical protein
MIVFSLRMSTILICFDDININWVLIFPPNNAKNTSISPTPTTTAGNPLDQYLMS